MPRLLKLEPHKSIEELEKLYRQTQDPIERTRWQILWLIAKGHKVEEVAEVTGYGRGSIYRSIVGRYNQLGIDGLKKESGDSNSGDRINVRGDSNPNQLRTPRVTVGIYTRIGFQPGASSEEPAPKKFY